MKVTNVKFIDRETGKVFLSLDQAEIEMVEKNEGQDEFISTLVRELIDIFYGEAKWPSEKINIFG